MTYVELLSVDQLAQILHKSPASIRSDASRNPAALPPICRLPGNKRLLFRPEDVQEWIAGHVSHSIDSSPAPLPTDVSNRKKTRGRPRKVYAPLSDIVVETSSTL